MAWKNVQYENGKYKIGSGGGGSGHDYSTTEQVVGTWINSEPLYEKTVDIGNLPNAGASYTNHGISNLGLVCSLQGFATNSSGTRLLIPNASTNSSICNHSIHQNHKLKNTYRRGNLKCQ